MTDTYGSTPRSDDINDDDVETQRLDREASAFLAGSEDRAFAPTASVRQAVREDLGHARQIARHKAEAARDVIVEQPLKTTLYALGVGVLIGLLLRR